MTKTINILTAFLLAVGAAAASITGCELVAAVDRDKITGTGGAGGTTTTMTSMGGMDAGTDAPPNCGDGGTVCTSPSDCTTQTTKCIVDTCTNSCCGTMNAQAGATCNDNGGSVCDGNGKCVQCNSPTDCPATGTKCKTNTCNNNVCGTMDAAEATSCNDNGGTVCNATGSCVSALCSDHMMDGDETDVDCGGGSFMGQPACPPCPDTLKCKTGTDCVDKICGGMQGACTTGCTCNAPTCSDGVQNGTETDQDCGGATCDGMGKTCTTNQNCGGNNDCASGDCQSMKCVLKPDGTVCGAGSECLNGHCVTDDSNNSQKVCCNTGCTAGTMASCGDDGNCLHNGTACADWSSSTQCATAKCVDGANSSTATAASNCDGSGNCPAGTTTPCGAYKCGGTTCKTSCTGDGDCITGDFCQGTSCVPKLTDGAVCTVGTQCKDSICFGPGPEHCCVSGGCNVSDPTCGATDCASGSGTCVYPTSSTPCGTASCNGSMFTPQGACNSMGACTAGTPVTCTDQGATSCGTNGSCTTGGGCSKYPSGTVCDKCNTITNVYTPGTCNGTGTCNASTPGNCPGNYACASSTTCKTSCANSGDCAASTTCSGDGKCCTQACGPCGTCSGGTTCTTAAQGTTTPSCTGNFACDGAGVASADCKLASGQNCAGNDSLCASGTCCTGTDMPTTGCPGNNKCL